MNVKELQLLLKQVPAGQDIIVKGRRAPLIGVSLPDGPVPKGWRRTIEVAIQQQPGMMRCVIGGWQNPIGGK